MFEIVAVTSAGEIHSPAAPYGEEPKMFLLVHREELASFDDIASALEALRNLEERQ